MCEIKEQFGHYTRRGNCDLTVPRMLHVTATKYLFLDLQRFKELDCLIIFSGIIENMDEETSFSIMVPHSRPRSCALATHSCRATTCTAAAKWLRRSEQSFFLYIDKKRTNTGWSNCSIYACSERKKIRPKNLIFEQDHTSSTRTILRNESSFFNVCNLVFLWSRSWYYVPLP